VRNGYFKDCGQAINTDSGGFLNDTGSTYTSNVTDFKAHASVITTSQSSATTSKSAGGMIVVNGAWV
jgi:hypothetical protein